MDRVCRVVQRTVVAAEAKPALVRFYSRAANAAVKTAMQQTLRRSIYKAIFERAAQPRSH
jgi:hypothetical protein